MPVRTQIFVTKNGFGRDLEYSETIDYCTSSLLAGRCHRGRRLCRTPASLTRSLPASTPLPILSLFSCPINACVDDCFYHPYGLKGNLGILLDHHLTTDCKPPPSPPRPVSPRCPADHRGTLLPLGRPIRSVLSVDDSVAGVEDPNVFIPPTGCKPFPKPKPPAPPAPPPRPPTPKTCTSALKANCGKAGKKENCIECVDADPSLKKICSLTEIMNFCDPTV